MRGCCCYYVTVQVRRTCPRAAFLTIQLQAGACSLELDRYHIILYQ